MSIKVQALVYAARFGNATLKAVALKLADCADDDGGSVFPARATVAHAAEVSEATVKRAIRVMMTKGLLRVVSEGGHGPRSTNEYAFDLGLLLALGGGSSPLVALPDIEAPDTPEEVVPPVAKGVTLTPLATPVRGSPGTLRGSPSTDKGVTLTPNPSGTVTNRQCSRAGAPAAATPRDRLDAMEAALRAALGPAGNDAAPGLCNLAPVLGWLDAGADLERDVLPAIRAKARALAPASVRSWQFFSGPVADWRAARARGLSPAGGAPPPDPASFTAADWAGRLKWSAEHGGAWDEAAWGRREEAERIVAREGIGA